MRIMIVEDNHIIRMMIRMVIGEQSNEFFEFENGLEAVGAYPALKPDYVLMDISMDIMDGVTATKHIIAVDQKANIIIVTDYDTSSFRTEAMSAGAKAYVLKENLFEVQELLDPKLKMSAENPHRV